MFGRLASTSTLAGLLARRTEALHCGRWPWSKPLAQARWKLVIHAARAERGAGRYADGTRSDHGASQPGRSNALINAAPADWFWVHNRWKTPKPKFLLATYRRGITSCLPTRRPDSALKPFRILVRSTNWLGDAVMTIPAVQALARGRPDAQVTVLTPRQAR